MNYELNAKRLLCPMPVIRTQERVAELKEGDQLTLYATDSGVKQDIPAWCRLHGHRLIAIDQQEDEIVITIRVGAEP
ncbi:sulfurtransferase TusA family protein [Ectothiorhodospiraceae bacterium BW-2]|nr:sulfurtransferase TusA family protein [Ectothiorhodospiraceae bacterium BW-2]